MTKSTTLPSRFPPEVRSDPKRRLTLAERRVLCDVIDAQARTYRLTGACDPWRAVRAWIKADLVKYGTLTDEDTRRLFGMMSGPYSQPDIFEGQAREFGIWATALTRMGADLMIRPLTPTKGPRHETAA